MDKPWLMGIDLGGSGARCLLVNRSSGTLVSASGSWQFAAAPGTFGTGYDIDLELVWEVVGKGLSRRPATGAHRILRGGGDRRVGDALQHGGARRGRESLLAVDNRDARAAGEYFEVAEKMGQQLLQETGCWPLPLHASARLLWLKKQQPDNFSQVHTVFGMGEWLTWRLSGVRAIDATLASATGLFHLTEKDMVLAVSLTNLACRGRSFPR